MKNFYLLLAISGAVIPYAFFVQHFGTEGYALPAFLAAVLATPAASGFAADLIISSLVFWFWMFSAGANAPKPWAFMVLNLLIGLSCALPAYLYWRERRAA
ncbi:MAG: DUF2834 domain-containing protein [Gammaproteobacteria bacterium]|nr:DUF2834 domain-containing protein [Gammaproteobacteria bacterium]MDH4256085.1 DUF2834 domain-containing protein [Gammaproteobacteria bacterium]MDH5311431.1 DUF2834 domain-containing protein [Gammaproteobacteria bacterium]